jgi:hypothetical protein
MERQLSSSDPLVRRAVAQYADPDKHRALLLRALNDPADGVRSMALDTLSNSQDPGLAELMRDEARKMERSALMWLLRHEPDHLVRLAADASLPTGLRLEYLKRLKEKEALSLPFPSVELLLGISRGPAQLDLREATMELVSAQLRQNPDRKFAAQIEERVLANFEAYPPSGAGTVLAQVGGPKSLASIIEVLTRSMPRNLSEFQAGINRILATCGPKDFPAVAAAFGKLAPNLQGTSSISDNLRPQLRSWLANVAEQGLDSQDLSRAANLMEPMIRREFMQYIGLPWVLRIPIGAPAAKLPTVDPAMLGLVREFPTNSSSEFRGARSIALGASGDPKVLPELAAVITSGQFPDGYSQWAIKHIAGKDPQRWRIVIEALLASDSVSVNDLTKTFRELIGDEFDYCW